FIIYIALIVFQPSIQFLPSYIIWFQDRQRLLELLLLTLTLIYSTSKYQSDKSILIDNKLRYSFSSLLILGAGSTLFALSPRHALIELSVFSGLCYLSLFVANLYSTDKETFIKRLTYILWTSILLYMLSFYVGYITAIVFKTTVQWPHPFTGFSNIRAFNQYQLWLIGFLCLPLLSFEFKNKKTYAYLQLALIFWWVLLFYSASRGVLLAWLIGILFTAAIYQKLAWPFIKLQLFQISAGFLSYQILFKLIPALNHSILVVGSISRETTEDRLALWQQAWILIKAFPILGAGPMHFAWYSKTNGHPHNSLLQLACEWGLPATVIILAITGYGLYHWFKKFNAASIKTHSNLDQNLVLILLFTLVSNAAYSLVDGVIVTPISQVLMFTFIGLMIGHYCHGQTNLISHKARFRPVFAAIVLLAMIWSTYPEIARGLSGNEKGFSMGYTAAGPRFWREMQ
ncbi:MAG: O-antigen ligase family protein, partial [Methylophilus sp.]